MASPDRVRRALRPRPTIDRLRRALGRRPGIDRLRRALRRRPYHVGLAALVGGLVLAPASFSLVAAAAALAAGALAAARAPVLALGAAGLLLAAAAGGHARIAALDHSELAARAPARLAARAQMLEPPRRSRFGSRATLRVTTGYARGARVLARAGGRVRWPSQAGPGTEVRLVGELRRPRARPSADFDYPAYLRRHGIYVELAVEELRATGARRGGLPGAIDRIRRRAERALTSGLSPPEAALARGMVLGEDEAVPDTVRDDFRRSGLAHVLAVSGQNVMLLCALALPLLGLLGVGPRARLAVLLGLIALYVPLAGAGPSLQRAGVMGAAGLIATAAGRPTSRWYALLLAAAATLALNPLVTGDPGWQLSFAAVVGILALGRPLRSALRPLPGPLAEGLVLTVAATVATAPLMAHLFGAVSLAGLPANVVAMPAVAATMWIGMLEAALGQLALGGALSGVADELLRGLGFANHVCLHVLGEIARRFAELPSAQLRVALPSTLAVVLAYSAMGVAALLVGWAGRRAGPSATAALAAWRRLAFRRRAAATTVAAALAAVGAAWVLSPPGPPAHLTVRYLDVGQGDATLVQDPTGAAVLFDGGPPEARVIRLLRRAGVRRLTAMVATHQSRDHQGGLLEVLERMPVDLFLDGGDRTRDPNFRAIEALADRRGVRRVLARQGQVLHAGHLTVRVLGPSPRSPGPPPDDPNPRALVTLVSEGGFNLLLSGDAESPSLLPLPLPRVQAIKVPHHGSRDPGLPALLGRLRPQVAGIEVGVANPYGHPAPPTLAALRAAVPHVYRTDRDGTVTLTVARGGMTVETER